MTVSWHWLTWHTYKYARMRCWLSRLQSRFMCEWVTSYKWLCHGTVTDMAHINMRECAADSPVYSHVLYVNESCPTYDCVMAHTYMCDMAHIWICKTTLLILKDCCVSRHVTHMNMSRPTHQLVPHMNESRHTYEWVMSDTWMSHIPRVDESCLTHGRVMSHIWMSHVSHMNESCLTYE